MQLYLKIDFKKAENQQQKYGSSKISNFLLTEELYRIPSQPSFWRKGLTI